MSYSYVTPDNLRHVWSFVKEGLEKVQAKGSSGWLVEDVYCDCFEKRSFLYILHKDTPFGFIVLQPIGKTLHIWVAWCNSDDPTDLGLGLEYSKEIAKQNGCTSLTFTSVRKGWEKRARQLGFVPSTWELKL